MPTCAYYCSPLQWAVGSVATRRLALTVGFALALGLALALG
jgi:hypothetical protein